MTAVREKRYVPLHGAEMNPSIRLVDGVEKLAAALSAMPR
jgi:iron complex transport system substrate-binding protein